MTSAEDIRYKDFVIQIGPPDCQGFAIRVLSSPAGEGEGRFRPPIQSQELDRLLQWVGRSIRNLNTATDEPREPWTPKRLGHELFQALFTGQVGKLFDRSQGMTFDSGSGLRVKLKFKLDPELAHLHSLPWEFLYQAETEDFLCLSRRTPLVRYLDVPRPIHLSPLPKALRILVMISNPKGLPQLDLEQERRNIEEAWGRHPQVEVAFLENAHIAGLRSAMLEKPFHVLHYMGHGSVQPDSREGLLYLEKPSGEWDPVRGESVATILKDFKSLRLVFLNACDTGRADGPNPFAGVATALVMGGVPAVVAMQFPISDWASIAFCNAFYERLAAGDPVDTAVSEGRQSIYSRDTHSKEWGTPVLFMRVADGVLFGRREVVGEAGPSAALPEAPLEDSSVRKGVGHRSRQHWLWPALLLLLWAGIGVGFDPAQRILLVMPWPSSRPPMEKVPVGDLQVARFEVSNRDYLPFVLANPHWRKENMKPTLHDGDYLKHWTSWRRFPEAISDHPVTYVSWHAAQAYCRWMGGRLPTEAEWRMAAHADANRFPWGPLGESSEIGTTLNFCDQACPRDWRDIAYLDGYPETAPADSFPTGRTPEGVYNLSGNVWEWCDKASNTRRVTMGGSYLATLAECSTDRSSWEEAVLSAPDGGFRCVWE